MYGLKALSAASPCVPLICGHILDSCHPSFLLWTNKGCYGDDDDDDGDGDDGDDDDDDGGDDDNDDNGNGFCVCTRFGISVPLTFLGAYLGFKKKVPIFHVFHAID